MSDSSLSTQERVLKAMSNVITSDELQVESSLEELGVDSLAAIEILFEVEEEFDINISGDSNKMHRLKTVRDVVEGVERLLAGDEASFWGEETEEEKQAAIDAAAAAASPDPAKGESPGEAPSA